MDKIIMKSLLYLSFYFILFLLQIFQLFAQEQVNDFMKINCEIVSIDSAGNYYVIYAKAGNTKYKIVSEKNNTVCQNIVVGQYYKLTLEKDYFKVMGDIFYRSFNGGSAIRIYGWGDGLYAASEISGLCYNPEYDNGYSDVFFKESWRKEGEEIYYETNPLFECEYEDNK